MTGAFDTHSHLQDPKLLPDFDSIMTRAARAGLIGIALCGYDVESNQLALELAEKSALLHPTVGFHPHEANGVSEAMLLELETLAALPQVVAIGEIGMDFYRDHSTPANQRKLIDHQLEIATRVLKPVCVHSRAAEATIGEHLLPFAQAVKARGLAVPGVMHCFGGTFEQAQPFLDAGFMVSIACPVTYPKNDEAHRLAREVPLQALVIETDSPYLPPQTRRGQLNEPAHVVEAARAIARLRGISMERLLEATSRNAGLLFNIPVDEPVAAL